MFYVNEDNFMKKINFLFSKFYTVLFLSISSFQINAQADLTVNVDELELQASYKKGEFIIIQGVVSNTGNQNAGSTTLTISLVNKNSGNIESSGRIICKPLDINVSTEFTYLLKLHNLLNIGLKEIRVEVDDENSINESNEGNNVYVTSEVNILNEYNNQSRRITPILFIHGLIGNANKWAELSSELTSKFGLANGGRLDFNLQADGNNSICSLLNDVIDLSMPILPGDFYTINFDIDADGTHLYDCTSESNQASFYKQALAVRMAIDKITAINQCEKVILVGHSMGGMAARTYLQIDSFWSDSNNSKVAKLYTIGSPHGGSNTTASVLNSISPINELSEAVRDLRTSYYGGADGLVLFGGVEDPNEVHGFISDFDNVDVNCNGVLYESIVGLNELSFPSNIEYACSYGVGSVLGGDGVVSEYSGNLSNFNSNEVDTFIIQNSSLVGELLHTELPVAYFETHLKGIDETDNTELANSFALNEIIAGTFTQQSNGISYDIDCFQFQITSDDWYNFSVHNLQNSDCKLTILKKTNLGEVLIANQSSNQESNLSLDVLLSPGVYVLKLEANSVDYNQLIPYYLGIRKSENALSVSTINTNLLNVYPNPASESVTIDLGLDKIEHLKITNSEGRLVYTTNDTDSKLTVDLSNLNQGLYFIHYKSKDSNGFRKLIVIK